MSTKGSVLLRLSVNNCMLFGMAETNCVLFAICAYFLHGCGKSRAVGHEHRRLDTARHERKTSCALDPSAKHNARSGMTKKSHVLSCIYLMFAFGIGVESCALLCMSRKSEVLHGMRAKGHAIYG